MAYLGVVPLALGFLTELSAGTDVSAQFDIGYYIGFVLRLLVAFGAVFELPVLTFFLARVGVVTASLMRSGRRYAIVVGFVLAALLTPPDPIEKLEGLVYGLVMQDDGVQDMLKRRAEGSE